MANDATDIVVGSNGQIYVGPTTATLPTDSTATPDAAFDELGFVSEDGVTITDSKDIESIQAWQSFYPVRKIVTGKEFMVAFQLRQWNSATVPFALGGGSITDEGAGEFSYEPPSPEDIDERALIVDWQDGSKNYRLVIPRGLVTENVETNLTRSAASDLPITFAVTPEDSATSPYTLYTDDPAFGPTGS